MRKSITYEIQKCNDILDNPRQMFLYCKQASKDPYKFYKEILGACKQIKEEHIQEDKKSYTVNDLIADIERELALHCKDNIQQKLKCITKNKIETPKRKQRL